MLTGWDEDGAVWRLVHREGMRPRWETEDGKTRDDLTLNTLEGHK